MWKRLYKALKQAGVDVYAPQAHQGECLEPYTVIKHAGSDSLGEFTSTRHLWDILVYIPFNAYSTLEDYVNNVKKIMSNELYPMFRSTGYISTPFYDDTVKGYMVSMQYVSYTKNESINSKLMSNKE